MNKFLKTRQEVDECTKYIQRNNLIEHAFSCKNWDVALICKELKGGDLLDMGSNGSFLLHNAIKLGIPGRKCGIDLGDPEYKIDGVEYIKGDLMKTPYEDNSFDTITCLSVIEHEVDYTLLAKECSRLIRKGGTIYITFDYWNPKVDTTDVGTALYGLKWNILDMQDVIVLQNAFINQGFSFNQPFGAMDWTTEEKVINPTFCAPYGKYYTFGIIHMTK